MWSVDNYKYILLNEHWTLQHYLLQNITKLLTFTSKTHWKTCKYCCCCLCSFCQKEGHRRWIYMPHRVLPSFPKNCAIARRIKKNCSIETITISTWLKSAATNIGIWQKVLLRITLRVPRMKTIYGYLLGHSKNNFTWLVKGY